MTPGRFALRSTIAWPVLVAFPMLCLTAFAGGVPTGAVVTAGKATVTTPKAGTVVVNQTSQRGIVKWTDFSIGQGNKVSFVQPGSGSATLNIVSGPDASLIAGTLQANGSVYLVNPNGVTIGPGGLVDAGAGFIASTLGIVDADFMTGKLRFGGQGGAVLNQGTINVGSGGSVALLGGMASNEGVINAPLGKVGLGAGAAATLDLKGDGFLQVVLPSGATTADGQALVDNSGTIAAAGGTVMLKASTVAEAMRNAINMPGTIRASSVSGHDGEIVLEGGAGGAVTVAGTLDASATAGAANGGRIDVSGATVALQGATVEATGVARGGEVRIGGAFQGGKAQDPSSERTAIYVGRFGAATPLQNASQTSVDANSAIDVAATGANGVGGTAIVWSDAKTTMLGQLSATGAGSGGAVEISSASQIQSFDLSRVHAGRGGWLLLDPQNITIDDTEATGIVASQMYTDGSGTTSLINSADILAVLDAGTNLTLQASNDINWTTTSSVVTPLAGHAAGDLTMSAGRSITLNGAFTTGGGQWNMTANDLRENGVVDAERQAGIADLNLSQAVFSGNNGLLNLRLEDGNGNSNQDAGSLRLGTYSGVGLTAWVRGSAENYTLNRKANIVVTGNEAASGDITLTGDLLFNGGNAVLSGAHVNWDGGGTIRGEGVVRFYEGGVLTHYGSLSGIDAVRMDLGQAGGLSGLTTQYGTSVGGFAVANQLHVDAASVTQPGVALTSILAAGSLQAISPDVHTPVGTASLSIAATSTFAINNGVGGGYFFNLAPAVSPVTITPRIIGGILFGGSTVNYTYGNPTQLYLLGFTGGASILAGDDVVPVATVNGTPGVALAGSALSPHQGVGTTSVVLTGLGGASASNYALAAGSVNLAATAVIAQKPLDYVNGTLSETYGSAVLQGPTLTGVVPGDDVTGINQVVTLTAGTAGASGDVPVGVYQVGYSGLAGAAAPNYVLQYVRTNTITVTPKALTVVTSATSDTVYGTQAVLNASLSGVVAGDAIGVNSQTGLVDGNSNAVALGPTTPAGSYSIGVSTQGLTGTGASNYTIATTGNSFGSLVVAPKPLTWHVNGALITYGDAVAEGSGSAFLFGVVPGDTLTTTVAVQDGNGVVPTLPNAGTVLSSVVTSLGGAAAGNYTLSTTGNSPGQVTVVPRPVSYEILNRSSVYGNAADPSTVLLHNVLAGDTVGYTEQVVTAFGGGANYDPRTAVGHYTDALLSIDGNPNYVLGGGNINGTVTVTPRPLTYVVPDTFSTYGNQAGFTGATLAGVLSGDVVNTGLSVLAFNGQSNTTQLNAGAYQTKVTTLGGLSAANYMLTDVGSTYGTLTIVARPVTYAISATQNGAAFTGGTYGAISSVQPTISYQLNGLVNGDTPGLAIAGGAIPKSGSGNLAAGNYNWYGTGLTGSAAGNYVLSGVSSGASATIVPAAVDVTLNAQIPGNPGIAYYGNGSQFSVSANFGAGQVKGGDFVFAQGGFDLGGQPALTAPDRIRPGTYDLGLVTGGAQGTDAANYTFHVIPATLTVQPRPVSVDVDPKTQTYGDQFALPGYGVAGGLPGDSVFVIAGLQSGGPDAFGHLPAGTYTVATTGLLGTDAGNYQIVDGGGNSGLPPTRATATYLVNPKPVTVTVDALNLVYGDRSPAVSSSGILATDAGTTYVGDVAQPLVVHGVTQPVVANANLVYTGIPSLLDAGTYTLYIGLGGPAAQNYVLSSDRLGIISVARKPVTASLSAVSTTYGTFNQPVTLTGFIRNDNFAPTLVATDASGAASTYSAQSDVGTYSNHVTGFQSVPSGANLNYIYVDTPAATAPLVITPKAITYTAPTATVAATYGDAPVLGALNGVLFNDDATVQVAGGTGMASGRAITDGTGNGVQYYGTRLDVGSYDWSVTGLSGPKAKDYALGNLGTGSLAVSQREVLYTVDVAGAQHGDYQIPTTGQYPWTPGASLGAAHFTNVMSGDTLTGSVALLDLNGNAATLDSKLAVGQYFEVVTGLTGAAAKNYRIAATGSQPGIFSVTPQLVSYTTTSGFYLPGTGYVGTPGTPTLYGPGGAFSDPNLTPVVNVFDSSGHVLTDLTLLSTGRYFFKVVGFTGPDAGDFTPVTGSYTGQYAQNDVGTLDIFANQNFGLSFPIAQQQAPVLPPLPAPPPAVQAPPLSGYWSSTNSEDSYKFQQVATGTGTAASGSTTATSAAGSATAQAANTQTVSVDGVDFSLDSSASVNALAKVGVTGVTLSVSADAHIDVKMTVGPGYVEYGAQADAEAKFEADRNGLKLGASVIVAATNQAGVGGSLGAAGTGSIDASASTFVYAKTDLAATVKDGKVTTEEKFQYGTGVSVGTELGLSGSVGSVDAGITVYSPGSVGVQFNYSAGYSDGNLSVSMGYGVEMLFGGAGGTLSFSLNIGSEVTAVTNTVDAVGNAVQGFLHLNDSPPAPKPDPGELALSAASFDNDPAGRYAFLVAHPQWRDSTDPKYSSYKSSDEQFFQSYQELVKTMNSVVLAEARQQAQVAALIDKGDVAGAVALVHSRDFTGGGQAAEQVVQYEAAQMGVHLTVSNGQLALVDNNRH